MCSAKLNLKVKVTFTHIITLTSSVRISILLFRVILFTTAAFTAQIIYRDYSYTRLPSLPADDLEKEVLTSSATHLVNMLKEGRVSSEKIVATFVQRIKKVRVPQFCKIQ